MPALKIGFLYNHDALHQIAHTISVAAVLAADPAVEVTIFASSAAQEGRARALLPAGLAERVRWRRLAIGPVARLLDRGLRRVLPFRRLAVLWRNRRALAAVNVLVVPETTSLLLRDRFGAKDLRIVWVPHGAGDRSVGYRREGGGFDLILVAGEKVRARMIEAGVAPAERIAVIGYPKFDTVDPAAPRPPLFDNGRPTVLYNPHFDPWLSSWYAMGEPLIDWFAGQHRLNLVVAPHVMLFQRQMHASVEHGVRAVRQDLPARWDAVPDIRIDTGSAASVDMTYTLGADIYVGDASSQIYEFLARPRPAIFLNPRRIDWRDDPSFAHWHLGEVVEDLSDLPAALERALAEPDRYAAAQRAAFARTFDIQSEPAGVRAARILRERFG